MTPRTPKLRGSVRPKLFWFVAGNPQGVSKDEIFEELYGGDPDGGPFDRVVDVNISYLNAKLRPCGLVIRREPRYRSMSPYQLRRLDNGNVWLPYALGSAS